MNSTDDVVFILLFIELKVKTHVGINEILF